MKLTDASIRSLPYTEKGQRYYADDAVIGFAVCVGTRSKTFTLIIRRGERRKRLTLGPSDPPRFTLAMAREKARDLLAAERLSKSEAPRTTFAAAFDAYCRIHVAGLRAGSIRAIRQTIDRHFRPTFANMVLSDINARDIAPILDKLADRPTERHNAFVYLRMFFNWCFRRGYLDGVPTARMETPRKPPSRERTLSPAELTAIWRAAPDDDYGRIVKLCILSGQRIGQWAACRREYVTGDTITWPAEVMKGKRSHTLPLTESMRALLPDRIGLLFPSAGARSFSNLSRSSARLRKDSNVLDVTHHDLRRTWATRSAWPSSRSRRSHCANC